MKGQSRQAVIVRSPDPELFVEAIFVVREDYLASPAGDRAALLRKAQQAALSLTREAAGEAAENGGLRAALRRLLRPGR